MEHILYIIIAVIALLLVLKFATKIIKIIFTVLFIAFVVYTFCGTDMLISIKEYFTSLTALPFTHIPFI